MAGLEVVVRPAVFPDIRPRARQSLPPQDDPEKGIAVIRGNPAQSVGLSNSWSVSTSQSRPKEVERRVDEVRVYQEEEDERGKKKVNKDNFVDLHVANRIKMSKPGKKSGFVGFNGDDTVATVPGRGFTGDDIETSHYQPVKEKPNIEIKRKNVILKDGEEK